ncbi:DUF6056 family protein [Prevotella sp. 10(H)]|uniref:DUF3329 domain-containing protein n=1 Tax=Prevotella sp. 10(H) TaxID=1158294 RepID=UPI0006918A36|nr:DUF6056 family protein [Prevotella sp. 10(H)]
MILGNTIEGTDDNKENKLLKITFGVIILIMWLYIFLLNKFYPVYLDDWGYAFNYCDGSEITSVWDIFQSQYCHYMTWGGRVVGHFVAQFLLWIGNMGADILNSLAYILLVMCMYIISNKSNKTNITLFLFINVFIWFSLPEPYQDLFWITGSANYLWGMLFIILFLCPYILYYFSPEKKEDKTYKNILFLFAGIIAGWTNENTTLALCFMLVVLILIMKMQKISIPKWMIFGFVGAVIGCLVMQLSPGNAIRREFDIADVHGATNVDLSFYFYRFVTVMKFAYTNLFTPFKIYLVILLLFLWRGPKDKNEKKKKLVVSLLFLVAGAVATVVMSGAPMFPNRAWFGILIFVIISAMILYANIDFSFLPLKVLNYTFGLALLIVCLLSAKETYSEMKQFDKIYAGWMVDIKQQKEKGIKDIIIYENFESKCSPFAIVKLKQFYIGESFWPEQFGKYMGVNSIIIRRIQDKKLFEGKGFAKDDISNHEQE